jgi:hypothetical protein
MKKYFLSTRYKLLHLGVGSALSLVITVFVFQFRKIPIFNLFLLALLGFTILSTIYWIRKENISVSEYGIEYEGPDFAFGTKWENIESISTGWYFPVKIEGVTADKSLIRVTKMAFGVTKRFPVWGFSQTVFIPLACFSDNWRDSELGQEIKQYAPHLFEK